MRMAIPKETLGKDIDDVGSTVPFPQQPRPGLERWRGRALLACGDAIEPGAKGGRKAALHFCLQLKSKEPALHWPAHAGRDVTSDQVRPELGQTNSIHRVEVSKRSHEARSVGSDAPEPPVSIA